jgi:arabinose-5-phosphate isomerase
MKIDYFKKHIEGVSKSFINLDSKLINELCDLLSDTKSSIFFTGVGKNGHVAATAASTFSSMGIPVMFINPVDAVHGDMGIIKENDIVVSVSKSGNTEELIAFLTNVKKRTKNTWIIHSNEKNISSELCSNDIYIEILEEADHLGIIPTISIAAYLIFLQSIGCIISEKRKLTLDQFQMNHPGGSLGKLKK